MANQEQVRFGIMGLGVGSSRAKMAAQAGGADLVVVCDLQESKVKQRADELGCEWTTDYQAMFNRDDIDAIGVFTPSGTHCRFAREALEAGKHAFTTKPMDVSLEACDKAIAAQDEAGKILAVDFGMRYTPLFHRVREAVQSGRIGRIVLGDLRMKWYRTQSYYDGGWPPGWRSRRDTEGGSAANQGVHSIDLLQWLMGPVQTVQGRCGTFAHEIDTEDCSVGLLTFKNGAFGVIQTTTCSYPNLGTAIEISGSKGTITLDGSNLVRYEIEGEKEPSIRDIDAGEGLPRNIIEDMVGAVRGERLPMVDGREGRKSVAIFNAIYQSSDTGEIIDMDSF